MGRLLRNNDSESGTEEALVAIEKEELYKQKAFSLYKEFNTLAFSNALPDEPPVRVRGKRKPFARGRFRFRYMRRRSKSLAYYDHRTKHITLYTDFAHYKEFP